MARGRTMSWTRHEKFHGHELETECEVTYSISGRYVRATRLDPSESPEVEIEAVKVEETGEAIDVDDLSASEVEEIEEKALEQAGESEADERAAALEDAADAARDERRMGC